VSLNGRSFAITIEGLVVKRNRRIRGPHPLLRIDPLYFLDELHFHGFPARLLRDMGIAAIRVIGTELTTLRLVESSVLNASNTSLLAREGQADDAQARTASDGFTGSVFPDGTLMGQISPEMLMGTRMEEFKL